MRPGCSKLWFAFSGRMSCPNKTCAPSYCHIDAYSLYFSVINSRYTHPSPHTNNRTDQEYPAATGTMNLNLIPTATAVLGKVGDGWYLSAARAIAMVV